MRQSDMPVIFRSCNVATTPPWLCVNATFKRLMFNFGAMMGLSKSSV